MKEALLKYWLASQGPGMPLAPIYNYFRAFFFQITYNPSRISVSR